LTSTGVGTIEDDTKIQKINKILHYEPEGSDPVEFLRNLTANFEKTRLDILKGYDDFASLIVRLKGNPPPLSVNGTDTKYKFSEDYYQCILDDLENIKTQINALQIGGDIDSANTAIKGLKMFSVNSFIKEFSSGEFRLAAASTNYNVHPTGKNKPTFVQRSGQQLTNKSFMNIGTSFFRQQGGGNPCEDMQLGGTIQDDNYIYFMNDYTAIGGPQKGFLIKVDDSDKDFGSPLLNQVSEAYIVSPEDRLPEIISNEADIEQQDSSLEDEKQFDAIGSLYQEIKFLFNSKPELQQYSFYSFWSEMMVRLEANPDYSSNNLNAYAEEIKNEFLSIDDGANPNAEEPVAQETSVFTFGQQPTGSVFPIAQPSTSGFDTPSKGLTKRSRAEAGLPENRPNQPNEGPNRMLVYGGKKQKSRTRKYVEKTNKKTKRINRSKSKKSKTKRSNKTRKY
jgi:hypothetical protein